MVSTFCVAELSKQQTGLRIDRVLFKQFQQLCALEELRPGEAVESIVRLAVDNGSIADLHANVAKRGGKGRALDDALFRSRLSRLKTCLETERRYWKETGEGMEQPESEEFVKELGRDRQEISQRRTGQRVRNGSSGSRQALRRYRERHDRGRDQPKKRDDRLTITGK